MRRRCSDTNHIHYANYGGRGIRVCDSWQKSFESFLSDMGERPHGMTLDRIDNNLGYNKENCKWSTRSEQNTNQKRSKRPGLGAKYEFCGSSLTIREWSNLTGVPAVTIGKRIAKGLEMQFVLSPSRMTAKKD